MKKFVELDVCGESFTLPVDMRIIEIIERVYNMNVDLVAATVLVNPAKIRLVDLAQVVEAWLAGKDTELTRRDIKSDVYTKSNDELNKLVGSIQAACMYFRKHIDERQFDLLARGEDLPAEPLADDDLDAKKP